MAMYKPGMQLATVLSVNDEINIDKDTKLAGIAVKLAIKADDKSQPPKLEDQLELPFIQEIGKDWRVDAFDFFDGQPEAINIRVDETFGVCEVRLYLDDKETSLTGNRANCNENKTTDTLILLPSEMPLVGFHGTVDMLGMTSLGVILVDTQDPQC